MGDDELESGCGDILVKESHQIFRKRSRLVKGRIFGGPGKRPGKRKGAVGNFDVVVRLTNNLPKTRIFRRGAVIGQLGSTRKLLVKMKDDKARV